MLNRPKRTERVSVRQLANQSATWAIFARGKVNDLITTAHHTLLISGVAAITLLGVMFFKPDIADQLIALSPFAEKTVEETSSSTVAPLTSMMDLPAHPLSSATRPALEATSKPQLQATETSALAVPDTQQKRVIYWLSKRYRVAGDAANMLVAHTYQTAKEIKLDPLLILAVIAIESGFNPYAESPVGAQGLMQVMSKIHHEKFQYLGGLKAALNPSANIKVGSLILKDYVNRGGSVEAGLKSYVGAAAFENDSGYGSRVLAEYRRLKEVATGKNVPIFTTASSVAPKPRQPERIQQKTEAQNEAASLPSDQQQPAIRKDDQVATL